MPAPRFRETDEEVQNEAQKRVSCVFFMPPVFRS